MTPGVFKMLIEHPCTVLQHPKHFRYGLDGFLRKADLSGGGGGGSAPPILLLPRVLIALVAVKGVWLQEAGGTGSIL